MNKKILLLALGAVSAMMLAVPAMSSAITALHLNPTPASATIHGVGQVTKSTTGGTAITCNGSASSASFEAGGTTGNMTLAFGPNCTTNLGGTCTSTGHASTITTTSLPFHLATVAHRTTGAVDRGILVTPNPTGVFWHATCHNVAGFLTVDTTVTGNGVIGTITAPACKAKSKTVTVVFQASSNGVQTHNKLAGTPTEYSLKKSEENMALSAHVTLTLSSESELVCT